MMVQELYEMLKPLTPEEQRVHQWRIGEDAYESVRAEVPNGPVWGSENVQIWGLPVIQDKDFEGVRLEARGLNDA